MRVANLEWDNEDACVGILDYIECLYFEMLISNNHELCFVLVPCCCSSFQLTILVQHFRYNFIYIYGYIWLYIFIYMDI